MNDFYGVSFSDGSYLSHSGRKGQKWGIRRALWYPIAAFEAYIRKGGGTEKQKSFHDRVNDNIKRYEVKYKKHEKIKSEQKAAAWQEKKTKMIATGDIKGISKNHDKFTEAEMYEAIKNHELDLMMKNRVKEENEKKQAEKEAARLEKEKLKDEKSKQEELLRQKEKESDKLKKEKEERRKYVEAGDLEFINKNVSSFTNEEIAEAINRHNAIKSVNTVLTKDKIEKGNKAWNATGDVVKKVDNVTGYAKTGLNAWNLMATSYNSFSGPNDGKLPIVELDMTKAKQAADKARDPKNNKDNKQQNQGNENKQQQNQDKGNGGNKNQNAGTVINQYFNNYDPETIKSAKAGAAAVAKDLMSDKTLQKDLAELKNAFKMELNPTVTSGGRSVMTTYDTNKTSMSKVDDNMTQLLDRLIRDEDLVSHDFIDELETILCHDALNMSEEEYISHYGILGMMWGVRRFQNPDGSLTEAGKKRYNKFSNMSDDELNKMRTKYSKLSKKGEGKKAGQFGTFGSTVLAATLAAPISVAVGTVTPGFLLAKVSTGAMVDMGLAEALSKKFDKNARESADFLNRMISDIQIERKINEQRKSRS